MRLMQEAGIGEIPVVVGGIIPPGDAASLRQSGVARVYTPKDFDLTQIMGDIAELLAPRDRAA
jgi:(2R)-ethylmalonyl-CoA mutase